VTAPGQEPADDWKRLTATAPWWSRARFVAEPLVVALVFVTLAARLWRFVDRFAVSLVYWDQWDFLDGFFEGRSWIEQFRWQHGPHRQGLAGLYYGRIYPATGWSSRFEAFVAWGVLVAAAWIALRLLRAVRGAVRLGDLFVPLAFFTYSSYEIFFGPQNLANGPLPLLLVFGAARTALEAPSPRRSMGLAALTSLALFTGFGLLLAPLVAMLFLVEGLHRGETPGARRAAFAGLAFLVAAGVAFGAGYRWLPASDCLANEPLAWTDYGVFLAALWGRAWGIVAWDTSRLIVVRLAVSLALLASAGAIAAWALAGRAAGDSGARRLRRALFLLCGYSTLFALMATAGRACLGPKAALAPRYTLYALPGMVGLYLWVSTRARRWRVPAVAALVLLLAVGEARAGGDRESARTLSEGRERWSVCYREKRSVELCDRKSGFSVYPADRREQTRLDDKLRYLEERSLSLFNGESGP